MKILYIPHDNRPIVDEQTIDIVERAGYKVVVPPKEFLGDRDNLGNPDRLWLWLEENTKKDIKAAVISSDSMLYGSLVGSRKHDYDKSLIMYRAEMFKEFRDKHKKLPLYVFGSIMRTPRSGAASGYEEPDYYRNYGANIFRYTALKDKEEMEGLTEKEKKELDFLDRLIPKKAIGDWMGRREKNFTANEKLIDLAKNQTFNCLLLGRDDNAPYSQTHKEGRYLKKYGSSLSGNKFQTVAGIDEIGLMMLTRAVNDYTKNSPNIFVRYNWGRGADTIPSYSDETIGDSIRAEILAVGAKLVNEEKTADIIFAVNTDEQGNTFEANTAKNDGKETKSAKYFADMVQDYVTAGKNVVVADVAFANGSDNALMEVLNRRGLLFNLQAYSGWNTATNSTGYALSTGILAKKMSPEDKRSILLTRYLDDWVYQANVRNIVGSQLSWVRGEGFYDILKDKRYTAAGECEKMMTIFVENNLPNAHIGKSLRIDFPWNRMFEARIYFK
ncbi:MAG: DUF4127 family protein [Selenomonadaceae bacterium]|nr:DUF4127 family protein [Selenomonadaceae bacterium]